MENVVCKVYWAALLVSLMGVVAACGGVATPGDIPPMTPEEAQSAPTSQPTDTPPADLPVETEAAPTTVGLPREIVAPDSPILPTSPVVEPTAPAPPGNAAALTAAITDLAKQTGYLTDQITVASVQPMEWPDASLGCPQEGMMYAQVVTPGYLVVLEAGGQTFEYHTDQGSTAVLCPK